MAGANKEIDTTKDVVGETNAELEAAKTEAENAKAEAEAARAEAEELRAELEKVKAKEGKKNTGKSIDKQEEELVPVFLIKTKEKKEDFFCAINGKTYLIKRGEPVMVPKSVEEIIRHQNQMDQIALENLEKANKQFA